MTDRIEAAAKRLYEFEDCDLDADWEDASPAVRRAYLQLAAVALDEGLWEDK